MGEKKDQFWHLTGEIDNLGGLKLASILEEYRQKFRGNYLLKRSNYEQVKIIKLYMAILDKARDENAPFRGKEIKGKTRDIIADEFDISPATAGKLIAQAKGKSIKKGEKNPLKSLYGKIKDMNKEDLSEEDRRMIEMIQKKLLEIS